MTTNNRFDDYITPSYSAIEPHERTYENDLSKEIILFLKNNPEFLKNNANLQCLYYCFEHYVNVDPGSRYLPIQDKIKRAGEMAISFLGIFKGPQK